MVLDGIIHIFVFFIGFVSFAYYTSATQVERQDNLQKRGTDEPGKLTKRGNLKYFSQRHPQLLPTFS